MEYSEFIEIVERVKKQKPLLFGLGFDNAPDREEIVCFEEKYGIVLPDKYKRFIMEYGGGYFGFANIYSLDESSDFYIMHPRNNSGNMIGGLLHIADNGCGDYYAFGITNGRCDDTVLFCEHDGGGAVTCRYSDVLEYLVSEGLKEELV